MSGTRQPGRSARRPLTHFITDAVSSAAPSRAPSTVGPPPSVRVTKAGSSGYTISLATSFHRETSERPFTVTGTRDGGGGTGVILSLIHISEPTRLLSI